MKIKLITDTTFNIDQNTIEKYDIDQVSLTIMIDGNSHKEDEISREFVLNSLENGKKVTTSQPSPEEFLKSYQKYHNDYDLVIVFTIAKTISGTYNSAVIAAEMSGFENIKVISLNKSNFGSQNIFQAALDDIIKANSVEEIDDIVNKVNNNGTLLFKISDIMHLHRGGRVSGLAAKIGGLLRVKVIIGQHQDGTLHNEHITRTESKVIKYFVDKITEAAIEGKKHFIKIVNINEDENSSSLLKALKEKFPNAIFSETKYIGPTFTAHLGKSGYGVCITSY